MDKKLKLKEIFEGERKKDYGSREDFSALLSKFEPRSDSVAKITTKPKKVWIPQLNYFVAFATCYVFIFWFVNLNGADKNDESMTATSTEAITPAMSTTTGIVTGNLTKIKPETNPKLKTAVPAQNNNTRKQELKNETIGVLDGINSFDENQQNYEEI